MNTGNTAVDHGRWKSWSQLTTEDRLLLAYCEEMGGLLVTEVPVGGHRKAIWPEGSKVWRIDGVRILDSSRATGEIVSFSAIGPEKFEARVKDRGVEVVEVERKMNRLVVGQAIVGVDMFRIEYGTSAILPVVVVGVGDPALESVCDRGGASRMDPVGRTKMVYGGDGVGEMPGRPSPDPIRMSGPCARISTDHLIP